MLQLTALALLSLARPAMTTVMSSADSALNLLDTTDFFVCGSLVAGMDGHYIASDEPQSDVTTPVFVRADGDDHDTNTDFRLYRHNGFWLFADVAAWPPKTHFRCDPTKQNLQGVHAMEACGVNLATPPRVGYSSVDPALHAIELYENACSAPLTTPKAEL